MHFQTRLLPDNLDITPLCKLKPDHYPYALISTTQGADDRNNDRYNILFAYPQSSLILDHEFTLTNNANLNIKEKSGFLDTLQNWWQSQSLEKQTLSQPELNLPFTGGWFVYLSYELAAEIEPRLHLPDPHQANPVAIAARCPAAVIVDRQENKSIAVAENEYSFLLDDIEHDCAVLNREPAISSINTDSKIKVTEIHEADPDSYLKKIERIKQYIRDGDIFQANLSRPWSAILSEESAANLDDVDVFKQLSRSNPGSFSALVKIQDMVVMSSSPERLVRVRNNNIDTRPIAGTRPRSNDDVTDEALASELLAHPKERAEHIMLIDLERNDLGRICLPGSIEVNELMALESYQHVHHIVSNVQGKLRKNITPVDIIRAVFPGGTITGCPKVRCMEILAEMEKAPRGAYTGSVGYINRDGSMELNILIRTLIRQDNIISFRAGGGIVADSKPLKELEETRAKAKGLLTIFEKQAEACGV